MKDIFEIEIREDGTIRMMYQDGVEKMAEEMGGTITTSCRASDVEWEEVGSEKGWTVRSAYDKELAVRWIHNFGSVGMRPKINECRDERSNFACSKEGDIAVFSTREEALKEEVKHFWALLAPKREGNNGG